MTATGRLVTAVAALLMIGAGPATLGADANEADAAAVMPDTAIVTTAQAEVTEIEARVPVTGSLVARDPVQIHANISGYQIREILAEAGDTVAAGDVLLRLDDATLGARLAQAEAEYSRAEAAVSQAETEIVSAEAMLTQSVSVLERTRSLRRSGSAAQAVLDDAIANEAAARASANSAAQGLAVAKAQLAQALAARRIAELDLSHAEVTAPVSGLVVSRNAEIGAMSGSGGEPLFRLIAGGEIEMAGDVTESGLAQIDNGDRVELELAGIGAVAGQVRLVPPAVDPVTRLGVARIALAPDPRLRIGIFANGWIITDRREAVTVPATAVLADADGARLQVIQDGIVETRPVQAGLLWQGRREILEGLAPGEWVIARAGAFFQDGDKVRAAPMPDKAAP
ncbi:efflux RND transporter periplasmic adaptor subunit [Paracoccus ravus]|uniref:efflux RND transporter periplasmic adaptor subunit n=1 Tax=Paracoccus ravus TaxID=2447760 RepID=UPI00106E0327|nr:efflux RND transporter periplasmic adaptor subunit [Paracoccus ravus]